ncbi:MAG: S9 family peptidase [Alphaproteobacteria bacterium]|nr:S9 family peptidase [Alphaproteobacteria bacterium]
MTQKIYFIGLILLLLLGTIIAYILLEKGTPVPKKNHANELISRSIFLGNPDRLKVRLSSDGKNISFLAPEAGVLNIWVAPKDKPNQAQAITHSEKRGIPDYFWAYTNQHILYIQDQEGDENWHLFSVDIQTKKIKNLTPFKGVQARIENISPIFPNEIIISMNKRDPVFHDLYRLNILTGAMTLLEKNTEFAGYMVDHNFQVRFAMRPTADGGQEMLEKVNSNWKPFSQIAVEDIITTYPMGFNKTGTILYMKDSRGRNTAALYEINLKTKIKTLLAHDSQADMSDVISHPSDHTIQAFASTYERKSWQILDTALEKDIKYLNAVQRGDMEILARSLDDNFWIVGYLNDQGPVSYYLYDRTVGHAQYLFSSNKKLESLDLAPMHPVIIPTRDGFNMVSYLSLPLSADPEGVGKSDHPLSLVLYVHGGPTVRDNWGYDSIHQWLTNRGYAVLSVNYRGSTGFGKAFTIAGYGQWAGKAHDDLIDAVNWAIAKGIADPQKIAIMGGSYGGYATLVGLTFTPDVFACGVDIVGPSNLQTLLASVPAYWKPQLNMLKVRIGGDPETPEGREFLKSQSPLTYAHKIKKPLLIGQGANDPRVKQAESDQIVKVLEANKIPVTYILYPDEGHGFKRPENRKSFFAVTEAFLGNILGGRVEPVGDDFKGSSIQIKVEGGLNLSNNTLAQ